MSTSSAGLAKKMGYENVKVMLKGDAGWQALGRPLVASDKFVQEGNIVLVDLRSKEESAKGYIPRSVNIPFADLDDREDDFPSNKSAPIVLYGNGGDAKEAWKTLQDWGYKKVSLVSGGYDKWTKSGKKVATGAAGDQINWVRILGKGEVNVAEFQEAVGNPASGKLILDVRTKDEAAGGAFANSVNIPLDEVEKRIGELPKDKELLVHCSTGARADMAFQALNKAGYKVRFIVANVECTGGACTIQE
jgi:rhodanese-related sulfurtransferase